MEYFVIGISSNPLFSFSEEINSLLEKHTVFSGGKRHYDLVKAKLPAQYNWIEISGDFHELFEKYKKYSLPIVIFASGDPLFYGFANTIKKHHPEAKLKIFPYFNSLQLLCHKNNIPYSSLTSTSVHGRSWQELDEALIKQEKLIGVLTDNNKTPSRIAQRLLDYNSNNYNMIVGEDLDGVNEKVSSWKLSAAVKQSFHPLNCILLIRQEQRKKTFGIQDAEFIGLNNRPNMITKMPVRLTTLSQLDLHNRKTFWDIGFCTASVSIEAKTLFPHLNCIAFEKREECNAIFEMNTRKFSSPGITKIMGDFFDSDLSSLPEPDAVFIGGHGNQLEKLICRLNEVMSPKARMVMNVVMEESKQQFISTIENLNYTLINQVVIRVDEHNPVTILTAEKN